MAALRKNEDGSWEEHKDASMLRYVASYAYEGATRAENISTSIVSAGTGFLIGLISAKAIEKHARKNNPKTADLLFGDDSKVA